MHIFEMKQGCMFLTIYVYLKNCGYKRIRLFVHGEDDTTAHLFTSLISTLQPFFGVLFSP